MVFTLKRFDFLALSLLGFVHNEAYTAAFTSDR
jgi:hypothetical protein